VRGAEAVSLDAQAAFERAQSAERQASHNLQQATHQRIVILGQIAGIDELISSLRAEIAGIDPTPPVAEITARLEALQQARVRSADLEAARSRRREELRQAEDAAVRCAKDVEACRNMLERSAAAVAALDLEIGRLSAQVRAQLGSPDAGGEDEAGQIDGIYGAGQKDLEEARARVQQCRLALQSIEEKMARNIRLAAEAGRHKAEEALYRDMATWLNAGNFQQYLMSSAFELLAHEGSRHLKELSSGRYTFAYDDAEFKVLDKWNGDEPRSVNTLSGGESFLASLSLALALAESIAELSSAGGAAALESLFLDEGFSSLDAETQSRVADAMQVLQGGKRLIGVITHVQALADQMPARIEVERTLAGSRVKL
jgi:exonuclease SbcC